MKLCELKALWEQFLVIKDSLYTVFKGCSTNFIDFWWNKKNRSIKKIHEKKQKYGAGGDDKLKIYFAWPKRIQSTTAMPYMHMMIGEYSASSSQC